MQTIHIKNHKLNKINNIQCFNIKNFLLPSDLPLKNMTSLKPQTPHKLTKAINSSGRSASAHRTCKFRKLSRCLFRPRKIVSTYVEIFSAALLCTWTKARARGYNDNVTLLANFARPR